MYCTENVIVVAFGSKVYVKGFVSVTNLYNYILQVINSLSANRFVLFLAKICDFKAVEILK